MYLYATGRKTQTGRWNGFATKPDECELQTELWLFCLCLLISELLSLSPMFLTQITLPLGLGLGRMFADRLSRQWEDRVWRVIQTVLFYPRAKHKQNSHDSLCLTVGKPRDNNWTQATIWHLTAQETAKNTTDRLWVVHTYTHMDVYRVLCRISHKCFLSNILSD